MHDYILRLYYISARKFLYKSIKTVPLNYYSCNLIGPIPTHERVWAEM